MLFIKTVVVLLAFIWAIRTLIRYDPSISVVKSYNKYVVLLWYTKFNRFSYDTRRTYIILFTI